MITSMTQRGDRKAIRHLVYHCGSLSNEDKVVILCDPSTRAIADEFLMHAVEKAPNSKLIEIAEQGRHGAEPPCFAADSMCEATLIISLCRHSLAHTRARSAAGDKGARFLSLPGYTWELLNEECLMVDYHSRAPVVRRFADAFTSGNIVRVRSQAGTDLTLHIEGRIGNYCPGFVRQPGDLGSPPDIEANVSPIETSAEGTIVVDGSVTCPEIGVLSSPVTMKVTAGKVTSFESQRDDVVQVLSRMFERPESSRRVVAECGVGLNPASRLTGNMLMDEGAQGCVHFGLGANSTVGGRNAVDFHLDFVIRHATLEIDGQPYLRDGVII